MTGISLENNDPFESGLREILDSGPDRKPDTPAARPLSEAFAALPEKQPSRVAGLLLRILALIAVAALLVGFGLRIAFL